MYFNDIFEWINYLQDKYLQKWWDYIQKPWVLLDEYCFYWENLKYIIFLEEYVSSNSSRYKVKTFNKLPKKYDEYFFNIDEG